MPMERSRYPQNWNEIALAAKQAADWTCQDCGRPCRMAGENLLEFFNRIAGCNWPGLDWVNQTAASTIFDNPQRFTLTTAHLDQNPQNNAPTNLKVLCAPCHLNHDRPFRQQNAVAKRERRGQLRMEGV